MVDGAWVSYVASLFVIFCYSDPDTLNRDLQHRNLQSGIVLQSGVQPSAHWRNSGQRIGEVTSAG